jgi:hypothetical protein
MPGKPTTKAEAIPFDWTWGLDNDYRRTTLVAGTGTTMSVFRRFFPNKQRQRVEQARQMIEHAIRKPREPKGCAASAESGADLRDRLFAVVEDVEKEIGDLAVIIAADGTLIHPRLIEVLEKRRVDGELLRLAINSCFVNPNAKQAINETWPTAVARYQSRPNDDELVDEKATALAG